MKRFSSVQWVGSISTGQGKITSESGILSMLPFSFSSKKNEDDKSGTNPEELVASAHASCFCMMLCNLLEKTSYTPKKLDVKATVKLDADARSITESHLRLKANIPEIDSETLEKFVKEAVETCPISRSLNAKITFECDLWFD